MYALQAKLQPMLFGGLWTDNFSILKTGIMLSSGMRRHTFFFVRKRGYTLHIDAPDEGDPLFGKLVDELAKGKAMEKIKRTNK